MMWTARISPKPWPKHRVGNIKKRQHETASADASQWENTNAFSTNGNE
jgi:hypothetical protein